VAYDQRLPPSISIGETRLGLHSSPTQALASIYSSASSLTLIAASQTRHVSGTNPATGYPEAGLSRMCLQSCISFENAVVGDTCKPFALRSITAPRVGHGSIPLNAID
jgi:hypothetical protein